VRTRKTGWPSACSTTTANATALTSTLTGTAAAPTSRASRRGRWSARQRRSESGRPTGESSCGGCCIRTGAAPSTGSRRSCPTAAWPRKPIRGGSTRTFRPTSRPVLRALRAAGDPVDAVVPAQHLALAPQERRPGRLVRAGQVVTSVGVEGRAHEAPLVAGDAAGLVADPVGGDEVAGVSPCAPGRRPSRQRRPPRGRAPALATKRASRPVLGTGSDDAHAPDATLDRLPVRRGARPSDANQAVRHECFSDGDHT
jgi:hypothetical protein